MEGMSKDSAEMAGASIVQENVTNIRTVRAMNTMDETIVRFQEEIFTKNQRSVGKELCQAVIFGGTQSMYLFVFALLFYFGALLMRYDGLSFNDLFRAMFGIVFAAFGAGLASTYAGDAGKAKQCCIRIFEMLDMETKIKQVDPIEDGGRISEVKVPTEVKGRIEFKNVWFRYPTRLDYVFQDLNLSIEPGQKVAFAGPSGQGKSTIVQLLLRFYDVNQGEILLDGVNIKYYSLYNLRNCFGLVSQEPYLFNNSLGYNIRYNMYDATQEEIRQSAVISNAIKFIEQDEKLEEEGEVGADETGFNRNVGVKGGNLSGGQKQRTAIARAVLRNPNIYLFDEATSALDSQSESVVQEALNRLSDGKTSISIAHRISTIKGCDIIFVIANKNIAESGKFDELLERKGLFWNINQDK